MLYQKHVATTTPVTQLVTGGVYKIMNPTPSSPTGSSSVQAALVASNLWSGVTIAPDGSYVTGTYTGPAAPSATGVTVYKVG